MDVRERVMQQIADDLDRRGVTWVPVGPWNSQLAVALTRHRIHNAARKLGRKANTTAGPLFVMGWLR